MFSKKMLTLWQRHVGWMVQEIQIWPAPILHRHLCFFLSLNLLRSNQGVCLASELGACWMTRGMSRNAWAFSVPLYGAAVFPWAWKSPRERLFLEELYGRSQRAAEPTAARRQLWTRWPDDSLMERGYKTSSPILWVPGWDWSRRMTRNQLADARHAFSEFEM